MIRITVNGEGRDVSPGIDLQALLEELGLNPQRVAVEHNRRVVRRGTYDQVSIREGDTLEIVRIVGGG